MGEYNVFWMKLSGADEISLLVNDYPWGIIV